MVIDNDTKKANYFDSMLDAIEFGTKQKEKTFLLRHNAVNDKYKVISELWKKDETAQLNELDIINATLHGFAYICPNCGEIVSMKYANFDDSNDKYAVCEHCETIINENMIIDNEIDEYPFYQWISDRVLDVEYVLDSRKNLIGVILYLTFGGPTIWIDTRRHEYRSSEGWNVYLPAEICEEINNYFAEVEEF